MPLGQGARRGRRSKRKTTSSTDTSPTRSPATTHVDPTTTTTSSSLPQPQLPLCKKKFIDLYDPDLTWVSINVAVNALHHVPSHDQRDREQHPPFVLCRDFWSHGECDKGQLCSFVHATSDQVVQVQHVHVNFQCRSAEASRYPRLSPGKVLNVMGPNGRAPSEEIPSELVFATRGCSDESNRQQSLSHCAHYHFNRVCNRGGNCLFVHVVHVCDDPSLHGTLTQVPISGRGGRGSGPRSMEESTTIRSKTSSSEASPKDPAVPLIEISRASPQSAECRNQQMRRNSIASNSDAQPIDMISLQSSFSNDGRLSARTSPIDDSLVDGLLRCMTPTSHDGEPVRTDSSRAAPGRSPTLLTVTVGTKTLLYARNSKDKDEMQTPSESRSEGSETTPLGFRHNPYGTPTRNVTPTF